MPINEHMMDCKPLGKVMKPGLVTGSATSRRAIETLSKVASASILLVGLDRFVTFLVVPVRMSGFAGACCIAFGSRLGVSIIPSKQYPLTPTMNIDITRPVRKILWGVRYILVPPKKSLSGSTGPGPRQDFALILQYVSRGSGYRSPWRCKQTNIVRRLPIG